METNIHDNFAKKERPAFEYNEKSFKHINTEMNLLKTRLISRFRRQNVLITEYSTRVRINKRGLASYFSKI